MGSTHHCTSNLSDTYVYEVDSYNTICRTSSSEDTEHPLIAESNWLPETRFEAIFSDETTRSVFLGVLEHVRQSEGTVSFPYRCDSPDASNFYRLTVSTSTARHVVFFNKLLGTDARPEGVLWQRRVVNDCNAHPVCSLCSRIHFRKQWMYFQELVDLDLWMQDGEEMHCWSTVCSLCERGVRQRLGQGIRISKVS